MADQELGLRLKTTSDVPEQLGKAKSAVVSFETQVRDIQRKFSTAFKDIALAFVAPLVIVNQVINMIQSAIADARQQAQEGLDLLAKGETTRASREESQAALFFKRMAEIKKEQELIEAGKLELARLILKEGIKLPALMQGIMSTTMTTKKAEFIFEEFKKDPRGQKIIKETLPEKKPETFKTPEGFSNVVGVGANPVIEAMNEQLEEQRKQTALLEKIASPEGGVPKDFTKDTK